ncbi:MAG TPA: hypothetical protein VM734_18750 [Kofleriaceae bacterium]|nr:hypothetical protein [Kofleriaceae bacterium]
MRFATLALIGLVALAACERRDRRPDDRIDPATIAVGARHRLRTDAVGVDDQARPATFVLVDADNRGDEPAKVWLGGVLVDADGHEVGRLRPEALIIPARGKRTFALVDDRQLERPTAVGARVDVRGARRLREPELITIGQGHTWDDHGKVVVTGMVQNRVDRPCVAVVLAGFHDADGVPMTRPFSVFQLGGGTEKPTRFVGPEGSRTGYIYVGDVQCWQPKP